MNILIKKYQEIFLNPELKIGGKWKISIVHRSGEENFIFGENMRPNLILDQGLDLLASSKHYTSYNGMNWNTIPAFLFGGAECGTSNAVPQNTDTELGNFLQFTNVVNDFSCEIIDNISTGTRKYKKIYDFPILSEGNSSVPIQEIGLTTPWGASSGDEQKLFSKFILPEPVNLMPEQYIRLYYEFSISSSNINNPLPIQINPTPIYPSFNPNGSMILAGRFADIYGSFDSNGFMRIEYGDSPRGSFLPYWDKFCLFPSENLSNCNLSCFGTSYLIEDTYVDISVNQPIICQWVGQRTSAENNTIEPSNYVNGNFYRDITYIFDKNNPQAQSKDIDSFLFTVVRSDRENTIDGWFWQFNQKQTKFNNKKLVITLRQSVSR